jgi:hypothetical protein
VTNRQSGFPDGAVLETCIALLSSTDHPGPCHLHTKSRIDCECGHFVAGEIAHCVSAAHPRDWEMRLHVNPATMSRLIPREPDKAEALRDYEP